MSLPTEAVVTLYDIASALTPQAWSPNTWKARLVLNYKRIPYNTVWVSYPDVESTVKKLGGTPTSILPDGSGRPWYTLPAIVDMSTSSAKPTVITDSLAIAEYLDAKYPERLVFPKTGKAYEYIFEEFFTKTISKTLPPVLWPLAPNVLDQRGRVYFRETREKWYGKKLEAFSPQDPDAQWEAVENGFDSLAAMLDKNGPDLDFVSGGTEPTWADVIILSYLTWLRLVAPEEGWNKRVRHWNGGRWEKLWNRSEEWRSVH